ncbi:MAG: PspC domain-containing protein [Candidatus Marinimicrobia bacterium]|nr:PspC domain-containing protein [Candidatus Neomarinimicrobiota bacterium]
MIIALGAWLLLRPSDNLLTSSGSVSEKSGKEEEGIGRIRLTRSLSDRKISGVCGGLGNYFNIDSTIIRIIWVVVTIGSFGFGILAYIIMLIALPEEESGVTSDS